MKKLVFISFFVTMLLCISFVGCSKRGCTDPKANNYDESAKKDDGSCIYDYRYAWIGTYDGTKTTNSWVMTIDDEEEEDGFGYVSYEIGPNDVTLEVWLATKDSVLEIKETGENSKDIMFYASLDGNIRRADYYGNGPFQGGSFIGDSLVFEVGSYGLGGSSTTFYKCKKRK